MHHGKGDRRQHLGWAALAMSRETDFEIELYILNLATSQFVRSAAVRACVR